MTTKSSWSYQSYTLEEQWSGRRTGHTSCLAQELTITRGGCPRRSISSFLKLSLIGHQLTQSKLSWQKKEKIRLLAPWIVFCYMQYWFLAPSLEDAAQNDIKLFTSLQKFNKVPEKLSKKIVTKTSAILQRHTWYLSEELIPISLFSDKVPDEEKEVIAAKIGKLPA